MCGWLYLDTMHVNCANSIMRYLLIWWSDLETGNTIVTVRTSRSFLWYVMNELMHVMQEQIDACNAIMIFGVHGWSFQPSSLIKLLVQNRVSTHIIIQSMAYRFTYTCSSKKDKVLITNKWMFMWMHDWPHLPYCILAPMHQWMDMWMHVHGIKARK